MYTDIYNVLFVLFAVSVAAVVVVFCGFLEQGGYAFSDCLFELIACDS